MEANSNNTTKESTSIALSGMILSFVGLICAMIESWRSIGMIIAFLALITSVFALARISRTGGKKARAVTGILVSIVAVLVAAYFLYLKSPVNTEPEAIPLELQHNEEQQSDHENALQKLENLTDSSAVN